MGDSKWRALGSREKDIMSCIQRHLPCKFAFGASERVYKGFHLFERNHKSFDISFLIFGVNRSSVTNDIASRTGSEFVSRQLKLRTLDKLGPCVEGVKKCRDSNRTAAVSESILER